MRHEFDRRPEGLARPVRAGPRPGRAADLPGVRGERRPRGRPGAVGRSLLRVPVHRQRRMVGVIRRVRDSVAERHALPRQRAHRPALPSSLALSAFVPEPRARRVEAQLAERADVHGVRVLVEHAATGKHVPALQAATADAGGELADAVPGAQEAVGLAGRHAEELVDGDVAVVGRRRRLDAAAPRREAQVGAEGAVVVF